MKHRRIKIAPPTPLLKRGRRVLVQFESCAGRLCSIPGTFRRTFRYRGKILKVVRLDFGGMQIRGYFAPIVQVARRQGIDIQEHHMTLVGVGDDWMIAL